MSFWNKCIELPQWPWTVRGLRYPKFVRVAPLPQPPIPKFNPVALRPPVFDLQAIWDRCTEWPQYDVECYKVKSSHICSTNTLQPTPIHKFQSSLLYEQPYPSYRPFEWSQRNPIYDALVRPNPKFQPVLLKDSRGHWYPIYVPPVLLSPKVHIGLAAWPAAFGLRAI